MKDLQGLVEKAERRWYEKGESIDDFCRWIVAEVIGRNVPDGADSGDISMNDDQIKYMVGRFLTWRLPENFRPDAGISFAPNFNEHTAYPMKHEPVGTNLFDATQAEEMIRYMVNGMPIAESRPVQQPATEPNWKWFGNAGHFICAQWCRFHLCTQVGKYLVSSVGEYWPERGVREIQAKVYDPRWLAENRHRKGDDFDFLYMKKFGFAEIGCDRKYETMVFLAGKPCDAPGCGCGLPAIDGSELDSGSYNDAKSATEGHMELCQKYARKQ